MVRVLRVVDSYTTVLVYSYELCTYECSYELRIGAVWGVERGTILGSRVLNVAFSQSHRGAQNEITKSPTMNNHDKTSAAPGG